MDQTRLAQYLQVLRHRGLGEGKLIDDRPGHALLALEQEAQDLDARRMTQRLGQARELLVRIERGIERWRRRPWIDLEAASADAIAAAVELCPTGALHYVREDDGPQEAAPQEVTVRVVRNGPYLLRGRVSILDDEGRVIREDTRVALCRCGQSQHMPFCDNSHRASGFRDDA
jgi:uncharacterized Fe-S cluster protein YjdI